MAQADVDVAPDDASAPSRESNYRAHLDGLHAVAVYLVVAFHAGLAGFAGGFIGVDVFFVLSGYLVTSILLRDLTSLGRVDLRRFYARRFRRILPAAAAALLITAVAYAIVATPSQMLDALGGFRAAFLYVANWHFVSQATDYFAPSVTASPVLHFWSLAVEEQFYFVWPLLLSGLYIVCLRAGKNSWWALRTIVGVLALASAIEAIRLGSTNVDRAYYGTDTRAYQLLAGALLALTPELMRLGTRFVRAAARWTAPLTLAGIVFFASSALGYSAIWRGVFAAILTVALIMALEGSPTSVVGRALSNDRVSYLGRISYATYLWHWPIIVLITHNNHLDPFPLFVVTAVGTSVLAAISYHFLEHPIRSSRRLDGYRVPVIVVGLTISAVCGLVIAPAILRWNTGGTANAASLSVSVPSLRTGNTKLLDWRIARNDIPALPSCFGKTIDHCTVVHGTGPSVLLVGDSLARMWLPTFTAVAKRESLTLSIAAVPTCPWQRLLTGGLKMSPACPSNRADWYNRVIPRLQPDIIFLAERGFDKVGNAFFVQSPGGQVPARSAAGQQMLTRASRLGIQSLRAPGRKIVILDATPLAPNENFDPVSCLSSGSLQCAFRVNTALTRLDLFFRSEAALPDVWNLDLDHLACPRLPLCDPVINGIIVRRDHTGTLTGTYARALATALDAVLHKQRILAASG